MNYLFMISILILVIGWPILIAGSIYVFVQGRRVYTLVKGSLIGNLTKTLVLTVLVEMYSLGVVCTAFMLFDQRSVYLILPVFLVWFIVFVKSLKVLRQAKIEAEKIAGK